MEKKNNLPNLIISGVHKSATTSVFDYLSAHPNIYGSLKKEIHYFTPLIYGKGLEEEEKYTRYFKDYKDESFLLEASPSYLYGQEMIIDKMKELLPKDHRVIMILRKPANRLTSFFKKLSTRGLIDEKFNLQMFFEQSLGHFERNEIEDTYIHRAVREGVYVNVLEPWIKAYGDRLKIIFFEDVKRDTKNCIEDISDWLEIDKTFYADFDFQISNKTRKVKSKSMQRIARGINLGFEPILRKNPGLKQKISKIYQRFNTSNEAILIDEDFKLQISAFYKPYNIALGQLLDKYNLNHASWTKNEKIEA